MNLQIFIAVLSALTNVTEQDPNGNYVAASALALKQTLELLAKDPGNAQQLNYMIASAVCNDRTAFDQVGEFVALCTTQGKRANVPQAMQVFQQMVAKVAIQ